MPGRRDLKANATAQPATEPCGADALRLQRFGTSGGTTLLLSLANPGSIGCYVSGYPRVELLDGRGVIPFRVEHIEDPQYPRRVERVDVPPGGFAYIEVATQDCDAPTRVASTLALTRPGGRRQTIALSEGRVVGYCSGSQEGSVVRISPVEECPGVCIGVSTGGEPSVVFP